MDLIETNNNIIDRVLHYGEGLCGTRQYWMHCRAELMDMIKQVGSQGMVFFTFSAVDLHWPDLHNLMPSGENPVKAESNQDAARH